MRVTARARPRDLFWNFARAEFELPPGGPRHTPPPISAPLRDRIVRGERDRLSPSEWQRLRAAVLATRSSIVRPVLARVAQWLFAEASPSDLEELRVMNLHIFTSLAPSRRLVDLTGALDAGLFPKIWDPRYYRDLRAGFRRERMHGVPILVAPRSSGPFTVIEGTTRLAAIVSGQSSGETRIAPVPVLLGIGPAIAEWEWY
jgi:hypothetical protein